MTPNLSRPNKIHQLNEFSQDSNNLVDSAQAEVDHASFQNANLSDLIHQLPAQSVSEASHPIVTAQPHIDSMPTQPAYLGVGTANPWAPQMQGQPQQFQQMNPQQMQRQMQAYMNHMQFLQMQNPQLLQAQQQYFDMAHQMGMSMGMSFGTGIGYGMNMGLSMGMGWPQQMAFGQPVTQMPQDFATVHPDQTDDQDIPISHRRRVPHRMMDGDVNLLENDQSRQEFLPMYMQTPYNPFAQVDDYPQQQQFGLGPLENPPTSIFGQMQNIASGHLGEPDLLNRAFRGNSDNDF